MTQRDNILQELNELGSQLANSSPENSYAVPAGYFDGLIGQVMNRIKASEAANPADELALLSPVLSNLSKQLPYSVPAGYFEGLSERMLQLVRESSDHLHKESFARTVNEETDAISPLLAGLKKEMPFTVPQGYFENLATNAATKETKQEAKIISLTSRKWFRYAAAAVVAGIIFMTGLLLINTNKEKESGAKTLAKVSRDVKKLSETQKDDLLDFLDAGMNGTETVEVNTTDKTKEIQQLLQDVSEEELKSFQQQTEDIEDVLMTN
ncbi:MAG TPA: hypothetical protein VMZ03_02320 [Chitinophagaceae bacterium]|nr:hypothetical protein [Chitinophagaceae bacterium]